MPVQQKSHCVFRMIKKACETVIPTMTGCDFCKRWSLKQSCKPCLCPTACKVRESSSVPGKACGLCKRRSDRGAGRYFTENAAIGGPAHMSRWCEYLYTRTWTGRHQNTFDFCPCNEEMIVLCPSGCESFCCKQS